MTSSGECSTPFVFNVRDYHAAGDGQTLDTLALQAAIDACHRQGGGTIFFPAGRYVTGSLFLHSYITLQLDAGATLLASEDPADYPVVRDRWEGVEQPIYAPLITGRDLAHIAITGRGTIDGRGKLWWQRFQSGELAHPRPRLIAFSNCAHVLIEGITAINSPSWTINPVRCENVTVSQVTIINPADSPNTDGINPDSCTNVQIANCYVSVGDDCITIKSGIELEDDDKRAPCRNVTITNCTMAHGHGGVVIGSEMSGGVQNVVISNCVFVGTDRGIRLKSRRGRGGVVEDVRVSNIVMTDVLCPLTMNLYYAVGEWGNLAIADKRPQPVNDGTPRFRRIHLNHITARGVKYAAAYLHGLAEMPVEDVTLSDFSVTMALDGEAGYPDMADDMAPMQRAGFFISNVRGLRLHHVEVTGQLGPALQLAESADVEISASLTRTSSGETPVVHLKNVDGAFVHGCQARADTEVFLHVEGIHSRRVVLRGNYLTRAARPVHLTAEVQPDAVWVDEFTSSAKERT
jgi:polygalacturonase